MAYKLYTLLADISNHGITRALSSIEYIVLHYTANKNDTAKANANYFKTGGKSASAHYFIDGTSVYQSVKDNVIAWSVGGSKYSDCDTTGGGKLYGIVKNSNSISVELCSTNGKFSDETLENASILVASLMKKYGIDIDHVVRHFDCVGKPCPKYWIGSLENEANYVYFKNLVSSRLGVSTTSTTSSTLNTWTKRLQKAIGVTVDGISGKNTLEKCPTIKYGSTGEVVKLLQEKLGITVDGEIGKVSLTTIKTYQKKNGLTVDGVFGQNSWKKLLGLS